MYSNFDSESAGTGTSNSQMQLVDSPQSSTDPEFRHERGGTLARNRPDGKTVRMSLDGAVSSRDSGVERQPTTTREAGGPSTTRGKKTERRGTLTEIFSNGH